MDITQARAIWFAIGKHHATRNIPQSSNTYKPRFRVVATVSVGDKSRLAFRDCDKMCLSYLAQRILQVRISCQTAHGGEMQNSRGCSMSTFGVVAGSSIELLLCSQDARAVWHPALVKQITLSQPREHQMLQATIAFENSNGEYRAPVHVLFLSDQFVRSVLGAAAVRWRFRHCTVSMAEFVSGWRPSSQHSGEERCDEVGDKEGAELYRKVIGIDNKIHHLERALCNSARSPFATAALNLLRRLGGHIDKTPMVRSKAMQTSGMNVGVVTVKADCTLSGFPALSVAVRSSERENAQFFPSYNVLHSADARAQRLQIRFVTFQSMCRSLGVPSGSCPSNLAVQKRLRRARKGSPSLARTPTVFRIFGTKGVSRKADSVIKDGTRHGEAECFAIASSLLTDHDSSTEVRYLYKQSTEYNYSMNRPRHGPKLRAGTMRAVQKMFKPAYDSDSPLSSFSLMWKSTQNLRKLRAFQYVHEQEVCGKVTLKAPFALLYGPFICSVLENEKVDLDIHVSSVE